MLEVVQKVVTSVEGVTSGLFWGLQPGVAFV